MQVETGLPKWSGRVPPLDLTSVSVCPRETERRWHKIQPISKKSYDSRIGTDGLPIGRFVKMHSLHPCLIISKGPFIKYAEKEED